MEQTGVRMAGAKSPSFRAQDYHKVGVVFVRYELSQDTRRRYTGVYAKSGKEKAKRQIKKHIQISVDIREHNTSTGTGNIPVKSQRIRLAWQCGPAGSAIPGYKE